MRAVAVVPGTANSLHVRDDAPDPRPAAGEALVRVLETGVCATDVEIAEGVFGEAPPGSPYLILGHENLGVVEQAPDDSGLVPGDLVMATCRRPCPQACVPCASGENDSCLTGDYLERGIKGLHGFMSERYAESPRYLVKVPSLVRDFGVLLEPMGVVQKGIEQAFLIQERLAWDPRRAVVLGAGPIGILAAAALRLRGLEVHVAALEPTGAFKDRHLDKAGIFYHSTSETPLDSLPDRVGPIDLVFEATGATAVILPAIRLLARNGICILSSVTAGESRASIDLAAWNRDLVLGNRLVFGTVNAARRHFEAGARDLELAERRLPGWMAELITRHVPFTEASAALHRRAEDIKIALSFS